MSIYEDLSTFVNTEGLRFTNLNQNILLGSSRNLIRYREFLDIIHERYQRLSKEFQVCMKEYLELSKKHGNGPMSSELMGALARQREVNIELQLEIESFYQYAKILLDRTANFMGVYFGEIPKVSWVSHNKICSSIETICQSLKLNKTEHFTESLKKLKESVVDYRDDHIVHKPCARDIHGISWDAVGTTKIYKGRIFPKESELEVGHKLSGNLSELLTEIDLYIGLVIELLKENSNKTAPI